MFERAKGFTRPIRSGSEPKFVPNDVINARDTLTAKINLNLSLRSKSTSDIPVKIGVMGQVFIKLQNGKRGNRSNHKPVIEFDKPSETVIEPGRNGHKINAAVEDVHFAIINCRYYFTLSFLLYLFNQISYLCCIFKGRIFN